jgi:predicted nucleic acid-binding protein
LKFLADFVLIDISVPISKRAFQLMLQFNMSHGLVIPDAFIAATAMEENLQLVTSNIRRARGNSQFASLTPRTFPTKQDDKNRV